MIRSSRSRLAVAGVSATAVVSALLVPLSTSFAAADTEPVAAPLAAPTGLTPDDSGVSPRPVLKTVPLHWNAVAGATGYRVEVGTEDTWSSDPVFTADTVTNTLFLPVALPHASYVWRVAALRGSTLGHWTSETGLAQNDAEFTRGWRDAPAVSTPTSGQAVVGRPTFHWSPVANASGYEVQVSTSPSFPRTATATPDTTPSPTAQTQAAVGTDTCFTSRTQVTPFTSQAAHGVDTVGPCSWTVLGTGSQLYWRVRSLDRFVDAATPSDTTPASSAGISYLPPSDTPNNSELVSDCPTSTSASASPSPSASASATPSAAATGGCSASHESEASNWSPAVPFTATYGATAGTLDPASLVTTTTLDSEPDGVCTVTSGAGEAEKATCTDVPTISWSPVTGASRYRVTVGLDDEFSNTQYIVESSALTWTPTDSWRDSSVGTSFYYVVQACDDTQCGAVTSTPPSFRKVTPRSVVGAAPGVRGPVVLSWQSYAARLAAASGQAATQDAYAYRVEVAKADHPSFDTTVLDKVVDGTSYASPTEAFGDGSYVWRVQALDSSAHPLPWSLSGSFLRDTTGPRITSVSPASNAATNQALTVTFSEPVTGVSSSTLTASTIGTGTTTAVAVLDSLTARIASTSTWRPGAKYALQLSSSVTDAVGNAATSAGPSFTVTPVVDDANAALTYSAGWTKLTSSNALGGTYRLATAASRTMSVGFSGKAVTVYGCLSPRGGLVDVTVAGKPTKRVSTYRSYSGCGVKLAVLDSLGSGPHTVRLTTTGTHVAGSKANDVSFDRIVVTP